MAEDERPHEPEPGIRGAGEGSDGEGHRLWGGRFAAGPAPTLEDLNRSLPIDGRLWREDLLGSRAWVEALRSGGVLTDEEAARLDAGLVRVGARLATGIPDGARDEDIHTLIERLLYEESGELAGKLHTGRSRNDQGVTGTRLWALAAADAIERELEGVAVALLDQAERHLDDVIPGYTHLRRAQPIRLAHWLLAHFWAIDRDRERLAQARERVAVLPLGSGALAGCAYPVDRSALAARLGFGEVSRNSLDAVGDRDWAVELAFVAALAAVHLSRLAEDLIVFSSQEFGFVELPEAYTTGSSLLPQKRNPDGLELARGKAALILGQVVVLLSLLKGLPSGYQKDLQEDKGALFTALDALLAVLPATRETISGLEWRTGRMRTACSDPDLLALDIADALVRRGVPFREAHGVVGSLLRLAAEEGVPLTKLHRDRWAEAHPAFGTEPPAVSIEASLEARGVPGGTARESVLEQIRAARRSLSAGPGAAPR